MELLQLPNFIDEQLDEMFDELYSSIETEFEVEPEVRPVCHESYDGFIPFTNGGTQLIASINLDYLVGSGKGFVNEKVTNEIDKTVGYCYISAREDFIANNRAELEKLFSAELLDSNSDEINYHSLYDLDAGKLAEELSETESGWLEGYLFVEHRVQYYAADNHRNETGEDEICFMSGVNLDYDYGRDKGLEVTFERTVPVNDLSVNIFKDITKKMLDSI